MARVMLAPSAEVIMNAPSSNSRLTNGLLVGILVLLVMAVALQVVALQHAGGMTWFGVLGRSSFPAEASNGKSKTAQKTTVDPVAVSGADPSEKRDRLEMMQSEIDRLFQEALYEIGLAHPQSGTPGPTSPTPPLKGVPDLFEHVRRMHRRIDALFASAMDDALHFGPPAAFDQGWTHLPATPAMNLREDGDDYVVRVHLPGVSRDAVQVTLNGPLLTISAEQSMATGAKDSCPSSVYRLRKVERSVRLPFVPADVAAIQADFKDGVLTVRVPKAVSKEYAAHSIPVR